MKLHSYKFPVEIENTELKDTFEFLPPYTITTALVQEQSHYVGYTLADNTGNTVDVYNINELKSYVKTYPNEFTNVSIDELGHIQVEDFLNLPHHETLKYDNVQSYAESMGVNIGLLSLLGIPIPPIKFYSYVRFNGTQKLRVSLTKEARNFIINELNKEDDTPFIMPPPLVKLGDRYVENCSKLFAEIDFSQKNIDFNLIDLNRYNCINNLFQNSTFDSLTIEQFNLAIKNVSLNFFNGVKCKTLNLKGVDFNEISSFKSAFALVDSDKVEIDSSLVPTRIGAEFKNHRIFYSTNIKEFDLTFFSKIPPKEFASGKSWFSGLSCDRLLNLDVLPLQTAKQLPNFFNGLTVNEFDANQLRLDSLEDDTDLFTGMICKNFIPRI